MGVHHDVYMKALLMHIAHNLYNMFDGKYRLEWLPTWKNKERGECWSAFRNRTFKQLTGFDYTRVNEIEAELKEHGNRLQPPGDRGPPKRDLVKEYPDLKRWFRDEATKASQGGYLTVERLQASFRVEFPLVGPVLPGRPLVNKVGGEALRQALLACEFQYGPRIEKRLQARESERILRELDRILRFFVENTTFIHSDISGKEVWKFTRPVAMTDESYLDASEYRDRSWHDAETRYKDVLKKSCRIVLLHTIFSGCNPSADLRCKYWNADWKKSRPAGFDGGQYFGKCNGETIESYYKEVFVSYGPNPRIEEEPHILYTDNARMHKRIRKELRGDPEDMLDWATESDEVDHETQVLLDALSASAPNKHPSRADILKALHANGVDIFATQRDARMHKARILFGPAYWSELNAIELLWAELKRFYRDCTDTSLPWEERLRLAIQSITPQFIESCFDRVIRFARRKYTERGLLPALPAEPVGPQKCQRHPHCVKPHLHIGRCLIRAPAPDAEAAAPAAAPVVAAEGAEIAPAEIAPAADAVPEVEVEGEEEEEEEVEEVEEGIPVVHHFFDHDFDEVEDEHFIDELGIAEE